MEINTQEIEEALAEGHFFLEYLPIMRIEEGTCMGAEALIRWQRDTQVVQPLDFIPHLENTPLSGLLTYWVIEKVAEELGDWLRDTEDGRISINVPPEILGRGGLLYSVTKCGLADVMHKLIMEITERGVPDQLAIKAIEGSKKKGVTVCLDDVGISSENLILLIRANVDMVKLDKSFADSMLAPDWSADAIRGLTAVTQSAAVQIIAEGVETEFQHNCFRDAGVQMAQGWHYSEPLRAADFMAFFRSRNGTAHTPPLPAPAA